MDAYRPAARARLRELFTANPGQWYDGLALEQIAGRYAWRTRVSELRTIDKLDIENRQRREQGRVVSEYRYAPRSLDQAVQESFL